MSDKDQPIVENAVRCGICQSAADRYANCFQCQSNPSHIGDLTVGIFSDLSYRTGTPLTDVFPEGMGIVMRSDRAVEIIDARDADAPHLDI